LLTGFSNFPSGAAYYFFQLWSNAPNVQINKKKKKIVEKKYRKKLLTLDLSHVIQKIQQNKKSHFLY